MAQDQKDGAQQENDGVEFIEPSKELKVRASAAGGITAQEAATGGQKVVEELAEEYDDTLREEIARLAGLARELETADAATFEDRRAVLMKAAHELKGVAGTFGYDLVTEIAGLFFHYLETVDDDAAHRTEMLRSMVDSLRLMVDQGATDRSAKAERRVAVSLRLAVDKRKERAPRRADAWADT
jgi:chemotaxis protein histidine kinase CheA